LNSSTSETTRGYVYALVGSVCGGSIPTLSKLLLEENGPVAITGLSVLISGVMLLFYKPKLKPQRRSLPYIVFFGLVGAAAAPLMFISGLNETTAVNAALLANGEVLFTTVIAFSVFGERLTRAQGSRGLLIVAGIVIVSTNLDLAHVEFLQGLAGNLLIVGGVFAWSVENNLLAIATKKFDVSSLSKFRNLLGGGLITAFVVIAGIPFDFAPFDVLVLVLLALTTTGGTYLFLAAVKRLGAVRMLLVWSTSTIFGAMFALIFLGEQITPVQLAGGACILLGVFLFRRTEKPEFAPSFTQPASA
jgi:drug/metabolite transporter (DMT)-like permease